MSNISQGQQLTSNEVALAAALAALPTNSGDAIVKTGATTLGQVGLTGITLQTNGTANGSQTLLNLAAGTGVTLTDNGSGQITIASSSSGGTVTTVSVVSANGFAGTVANATSTPAITLSTSITGILYGNGTAIAAAIAANFPTLNQSTTGTAAAWTTARNLAGNSVNGTANVAFANKFIVQGTTDSGLSAAQFLGALGTGILKNTTTTGVLTIAVAADFPTLNQSTTGTAAGLSATLVPASGGTGVVNNNSSTITISGAYGLTLTLSNTTSITLPTSGTLVNSAVATLSSLTSVGTLTTGTASTGFVVAGVTMTLGSDASYDIYYRGSTGVLTRLANGTTGQVLQANTSAAPTWAATYAGTVTTVSVTTSAGVSGSVATATTTPAITLTLGAITPTSVNGLTLAALSTGFTVAGGTTSKTLQVNNTLAFSGTDSTTMTFPSSSDTVVTLGATQTLTAKTLTTPAMTSVAETGVGTADLLAPNNHAVTVSSNAGTCSQSFELNTFTNSSAATMAITLGVSTPTPKDGQKMIVRVYDFSAVAQTIGWTNTENSTVSAPTTSNGSTTLPLTVGFIYNAATSKWRCVASA